MNISFYFSFVYLAFFLVNMRYTQYVLLLLHIITHFLYIKLYFISFTFKCIFPSFWWWWWVIIFYIYTFVKWVFRGGADKTSWNIWCKDNWSYVIFDLEKKWLLSVQTKVCYYIKQSRDFSTFILDFARTSYVYTHIKDNDK